MAGLLFLQEFNDWDDSEAILAYESHQNVRFALGLCPGISELSRRTLQRYRKHLIEDDSAMAVFTSITQKLADLMGLKVEKQRLDSTHIFSNMARFGRTQLMGIMIKRFLGQVKRHASKDYEALPEELRERYEPPRNKLFGDTGRDEKSYATLRRKVAADMYFLIERFHDDEAHNNRDTYKQMVRVFFEQCEVVEEQIRIKKKPGGDTMQNPSDPDATYDGKKGSGYQVQISETCHAENEQQLITAVIPQTATESDTHALNPVLDQLEANGLFPDEMLADSLYGVDENTQSAKKRGVDVVAPVKKGNEKSIPHADEVTEADFEFDDEQKKVKRCPAGHIPISSEYDAEKDRSETFMDAAICDQCSLVHECPVRKTRKSKEIGRAHV